VPSFGNFLDDLVAESFQVTRITRGDNASIVYDLAVFPLRASVFHVGLDGFIRGHLSALSDAGLYQKPGCMTHGRDDLLGLENFFDEFQRLRLDTREIRIDLAARQDDGIVFRCGYLLKSLINFYRPTSVLLVPALDFARRQRDDVHYCAGGLEPVPRHFQFRLLKPVGRQDRDFLPFDTHKLLSVRLLFSTNRRPKTSFRSADTARSPDLGSLAELDAL
jgi:hypothetical protein